MKRIVTHFGLLIAAACAVLATATPVNASNQRMRMDIPFNFVAGEVKLPAGIYYVRVDADYHNVDLTPANGTRTSRVRVKNGPVTRKVEASELGVLSFRQYGGTLVLKGVYAPGATDRFEVPASHAEIELAKFSGSAPAAATTVDLQYR